MLNNLDNAKKNLDDLEKNNSKFLPALGLRRKLLVEEIAKTSDPSKKKALRDSYNQLLPKLLANEPQNKSYSLEYARTLLSIGHPLHNPNALNQGLAIIRKFSRVNNQVDDAFLLLEIQFLEKQGKLTEAKGILDQLASANPLSPGIEYKRIELTTKLNPDSAPE
jgi:exopolyphosphatase/pppGpp-phosphohydrolase